MSMNKKRLAVNILCSICLIVMIFSFFSISFIVKPLGVERENVTGFYAEEENSLDVVYIGGSSCFEFWVPLKAFNDYGFTSYNFAHSAMSPIEIKYYIEEARKTQTPKLFVIDLRPFQYGEDMLYDENPTRWGLLGFNYSQNRHRMVSELTKNKDKTRSYYFDFLRYKSLLPYEIGSIISGNYSKLKYWNNKVENDLKGFYFANNIRQITFTDYKMVTDTTQLPEKTDYYFHDLLEYLSEENVETLFVVNSYSQEESHKKLYNYMEQEIYKYNLKFLNTNDYFYEIGYDVNMDFFDSSHVNIFGSEKYTEFLGSYIVNNYNLTDKRNNQEFSSWQQKYEDFVIEVKKNKEYLLSLKNEE